MIKHNENSSGAVHDRVKDKVSAGRAWFSIVIIVLLFIVAMIDRNAINLMIDPVKKSLGINDFQISLLQGPAFAAFFLLGSLLTGWLVDKYSNRSLIFIGVILWSFATIASGFSNSFIVLLITRCFVGLGESVLQPVGWNIVANLFAKHKLATALSILTASTQVGVAVSFLLTGFLIAEANQGALSEIPFVGEHLPWQWVFIAAGVPGLLLAFLVFIIPSIKKKTNSSGQKSAGELFAFIRENRAYLLCHFAGFGLLSIMVNGTAAWAPTYLMRTHGMEIKNIGLLLGLVGVPLGVSGVIVAGLLVDRSFKKGRNDAHLKHFSVRALIVALVGFVGFSVLGTNLISLLVCFGLIQFVQPFSGVAGASLQISTPEKYRARISAMFIMFYNAVGMMLGPSFVALLSNTFGTNELGIAIAINYLVLGSIAAILLWIGKKYAAAAYGRYGLQAN